jgi:serine/threonine protein kinase
MIGTAELTPGTFVDGWQVVRALKKGGFGAVHVVEQYGKSFALKLALRGEARQDERQTHARTLREVAILLMLAHPNIIKPRAYGYMPDGRVYLVLEYVEGWTLGEWLEHTHPTASELARVFTKIAAALAYMHSRGVLHRDLKLSNVLIRKSDGEPVIIDLGCATYANAEELTAPPLPPGTDRYRTPEAKGFPLKKGRKPGERYPFQVADELFAVGVMLYEVLTDPLPTLDNPRPDFSNPVMEPPPPTEVNPRVPAALSHLTMDLLARDPSLRPESAEALRRKLAELAEHKEPEYAVPIHPPSEQRPPARRQRAPGGAGKPAERAAQLQRWRKPLALAGMVAAVVLAAAVASWHAPRDQPPPSGAPAPALPSHVPTLSPGNVPPRSAPAPAPAQDSAPAANAASQEEGSTVKKTPDAPMQDPATPASRSAPSPSDPGFSAWCRSVAVAIATAAGCTSAHLGPEPFECEPGAVQAMEQELGWRMMMPLSMQLDDRGPDDGSLHLYSPGPVVGVVPKSVTPGRQPEAPPGTRFYGRLYITREKTYSGHPGELIGVYTRAKVPGKEEVPVCFVIGGDGVIPVEEFTEDGKAKAVTRGTGYPVERWP